MLRWKLDVTHQCIIDIARAGFFAAPVRFGHLGAFPCKPWTIEDLIVLDLSVSYPTSLAHATTIATTIERPRISRSPFSSRLGRALKERPHHHLIYPSYTARAMDRDHIGNERRVWMKN